jgi:cell wall assembly regulator SMI1
MTLLHPVKKELWNPHWIPLTDNGGGHCCFCVDLDPVVGGQIGQMVYITTDDLLRIVLADSFKEWLSEFADELGAGHFKWIEEEEAVVRVSGRDIFGRWYRDR